MKKIDKLLSKFGLVRSKLINEQLDYARNVAKRLDEHRELVESIAESTDLFKAKPWHIGHMATQDDYLMRLFFLRHSQWPLIDNLHTQQGYVRSRPKILGKCNLPEKEFKPE